MPKKKSAATNADRVLAYVDVFEAEDFTPGGGAPVGILRRIRELYAES